MLCSFMSCHVMSCYVMLYGGYITSISSLSGTMPRGHKRLSSELEKVGWIHKVVRNRLCEQTRAHSYSTQIISKHCNTTRCTFNDLFGGGIRCFGGYSIFHLRLHGFYKGVTRVLQWCYQVLWWRWHPWTKVCCLTIELDEVMVAATQDSEGMLLKSRILSRGRASNGLCMCRDK
jgi:hypothetical protein